MADKDPLGIVGKLIADKYRIERLVGEGGFAVVYKAEHVVWEQPVAVKLFSGLSQAPLETREALQRAFIREGALLAELSSQTAGIVQARDVGTYATPRGQWLLYIVLEWLEGSALDAVLAQDQAHGMVWSEDQALGFLKRVLPILGVAHERGISHRDIKPGNVFVLGTAARSKTTPLKLLDFGVAKTVSEHTRTSAALAKTGLAVTSFTPQYGAPEQFTRSYGATGPWTDVYALALVVSEMLVGKPVLDGTDVVQLGFATANPERRPTPGAFGARISESFEAVMRKALAVDPEDRFAHAGDFLEACLAVIEERGGSMRPTPPPEPTEIAPFPQNPALPWRAPSVPVAAGSNPTQHAAISSVGPPKPQGESALGVLLVTLIVLAGGTLVFSATDLRGAVETRAVVLALARSTKQKLSQWWPPSEGAADSVPVSATTPSDVAEAPPRRDCPEGMHRVVLEPKGAGEAERDGSAETQTALPAGTCIDERPVRESDYAACSSCEGPRLARGSAENQLASPSEYCLGKGLPTEDTLRCATARQAAVFCQSRGARLPMPEELESVSKLEEAKGDGALGEWTTAAAMAGNDERKAFRCARGSEASPE